MRLAFAITAHKDLELLNLLIVQVLSNDNCFVFIHLDSKASISANNIIKDDRVRVIENRIVVEWGDISHVRATNSLFKAITKDYVPYDYVILLSGQDLLIKPVEQLIEYLTINSHYELFMDACKLPVKEWPPSGGYDRILLHYPRIFRKKYNKNHPVRIIRAMYRRLYILRILNFKKQPEDIEFWGGSDWFIVSGSLLRLATTFIENNRWYDNFFKDSLIASEIYYPTLFMHLVNKSNVMTNNNLKYIDWNNPDKSENGSPRTFVLSDKNSIESSDKFFARKFSSVKDKEIINYFCDKISNPARNS
jgi:hypothetical protein